MSSGKLPRKETERETRDVGKILKDNSSEETFQDEESLSINYEQEGFESNEILSSKSNISAQKSVRSKSIKLLTDVQGVFQSYQDDRVKGKSLENIEKDASKNSISEITEAPGGVQREEIQASVEPRRNRCLSGENRARNLLTLMLFLGMVNAAFLRINLLVSLEDAVKHTKLAGLHPIECFTNKVQNRTKKPIKVGPIIWTETNRKHVLNAFFYGNFITQIPSGILVHKYGSKMMLGVGMVVNTILGFLTPLTASYGFFFLFMLRFFQGIGEGPVIPSCHTILANWSPPYERGRRVALVNCGAQIGMAITLPLSKYVSTNEMIGGWATMFYILSGLSTIWLICLYIFVFEDPIYHPKLKTRSKINILSAVWGTEIPRHRARIPWRGIMRSPPFWGIILAAVANSYSYEILLTEIPLFMTDVLNYNIKEHTLFAAMPYCFMALCSLIFSITFDELIIYGKLKIGSARKIANSFGQIGPAIALGVAGFTRCNGFLTLAVLTIGLGINGAVYCGYVVNHIDISPNFVCILVTITNFFANIVGFIVPILSSFTLYRNVKIATWGEVFFLTAGQYCVCNLYFSVFASGKRQEWDKDIPTDTLSRVEKALTIYTKIRRHLFLPS